MKFLRVLRTPIYRRWRLATIATALILATAGCSDTPENFIDRAQAHRARGDNVSAELEIRNALITYQQNPAVLLLAGQILADVGDLANAEHTLRRAIEYGSPKTEVVPILARVLVDMEKYPEALEVLAPEVKAGTAAAPALTLQRGRAHLGLGALLEARTEFHVAQNAQPSEQAKLGLARVALAERDRATADKLVAEALASDPKSIEALMLRAQLLRQDGKPDEAAAVYTQAIKLKPKDGALLAEAAALDLARNRTEAAEPLVEQARKIAPKHPRVRYASALLALNLKRYEGAVKDLVDLLRDVPNNAAAMRLMGIAQYADGKYDRAQIAFVDYLKRFPGDLGAIRMLAATLLAKGQPHLAARMLEPIVPATEDPGVLVVAAEANRLTGRFARSRAILQRALKLHSYFTSGLLTDNSIYCSTTTCSTSQSGLLGPVIRMSAYQTQNNTGNQTASPNESSPTSTWIGAQIRTYMMGSHVGIGITSVDDGAASAGPTMGAESMIDNNGVDDILVVDFLSTGWDVNALAVGRNCNASTTPATSCSGRNANISAWLTNTLPVGFTGNNGTAVPNVVNTALTVATGGAGQRLISGTATGRYLIITGKTSDYRDAFTIKGLSAERTIPVPGSVPLLGLALLALVWVSRSRRLHAIPVRVRR